MMAEKSVPTPEEIQAYLKAQEPTPATTRNPFATPAPPPVATPATDSWGQASGNADLVKGVSIPCKFNTPLGVVKVQMQLGAEAGQGVQTVKGAMQYLMQLGFELDAWKPKQNNGGSRW